MRASSDQLLGRMPRLLRLHRVPGCAVAVVHEGSVEGVGSYGVADEVTGSRVTDETRFQVASVSKIATAWVAMKLVDMAVIGVDEPVQPRLRRWRIPDSTFAIDAVTLRSLLTHTAGFPAAGSDPFASAAEIPRIEDVLLGVAATCPTALEVEPGTRFRYSNPGYAVIELLVEELTGSRFLDAAERTVLGPLGMASSTFDRSATDDDFSASPHVRRGVPLKRSFFNQLAAGGLFTTARDLAMLAVAMCESNGRFGGGVVSSDAVQQMWHSPPPARGAFRMKRGGYGMGQLWGQLASGTRFAANQGSRPGWRSLFVCLPDRGEALIMLTNSNSGLRMTLHATALWLRRVVREPLKLHKVVRLRG